MQKKTKVGGKCKNNRFAPLLDFPGRPLGRSAVATPVKDLLAVGYDVVAAVAVVVAVGVDVSGVARPSPSPAAASSLTRSCAKENNHKSCDISLKNPLRILQLRASARYLSNIYLIQI